MSLPIELMSWIGGLAAALTSLSCIPQVRKAWPRGSTKDVSLKMLVALTTGLVLWVVNGLLQKDWILVLANSVGAALAATVLCCKIRPAPSNQIMLAPGILKHLPQPERIKGGYALLVVIEVNKHVATLLLP